MNMKDRKSRSALATSSFIVALLGPVVTVVGILCVMFVSSLSPPARHHFGWVGDRVHTVVIVALFVSPPLALVLSAGALSKIRRAESPVRGRGLARWAIVISVLTLACLGWATPTYRNAQHQSETNACVSGNIRHLDSAKEQWAMSARATNGPPDIDGVLSYIKGGMPICPGDGEYTMGNIGELPRCSLHGTISNRYYPDWWE